MKRLQWMLLLPLFAAGCAIAAPPAATPVDADAGEVRFGRVTRQSVTVQVPADVHAAILDVRPGHLHVAQWLDGRGTRALAPGAHRVALDAQRQRLPGSGGRSCNRPGEYPVYDLETAQATNGLAEVREVNSAGGRVFCVRSQPLATGERMVLVIVSPHPVEDGLVEEVLLEFNHRNARAELDATQLSRGLSDLLTAEWPGSAAYSVRVPVP